MTDALREALQALDLAYGAVGRQFTDEALLHLGHAIAKLSALQEPAPVVAREPTKEMVDRFLRWKLPKDFAPDCGISFDGRKDDQWNKDKTWPIGTNLFTADQARQMIEHILQAPVEPAPVVQPERSLTISRYDDLINEARDLIRTPDGERDLSVFNRAAAELRDLLSKGRVVTTQGSSESGTHIPGTAQPSRG